MRNGDFSEVAAAFPAPSASTTRSQAAPAARAASSSRTTTIPARHGQLDLDATPCSTTRSRTPADANSERPRRRLRAAAGGHERPGQLRRQADLAAHASAQRSGPSSAMLDAEVIDNFTVSFDQGSTRRHPHLRREASATPGPCSPNLVLDGQLRHQPAGPDGGRPRTTAGTSARTCWASPAPTAATPPERPARLRHADLHPDQHLRPRHHTQLDAPLAPRAQLHVQLRASPG